VVHYGNSPSPPPGMPPVVQRASARHIAIHARPPSAVVPVGANYDTAAALMGVNDDDGRASLNGDEYL
jgi:hypothetical protein